MRRSILNLNYINSFLAVFGQHSKGKVVSAVSCDINYILDFAKAIFLDMKFSIKHI